MIFPTVEKYQLTLIRHFTLPPPPFFFYARSRSVNVCVWGRGGGKGERRAGYSGFHILAKYRKWVYQQKDKQLQHFASCFNVNIL